MTSISKVLALCALLVGAGCGHEAAHDALTGTGGTATAAINALCPISGEAVEADGGSIEYEGKTVGFCCEKCVGQFAALDDAGKVAALSKHGTALPK